MICGYHQMFDNICQMAGCLQALWIIYLTKMTNALDVIHYASPSSWALWYACTIIIGQFPTMDTGKTEIDGTCTVLLALWAEFWDVTGNITLFEYPQNANKLIATSVASLCFCCCSGYRVNKDTILLSLFSSWLFIFQVFFNVVVSVMDV